jgi:predicted DNA-binding WGR domain protein
MSRREFHFQDGKSQKFWAVEVVGPRCTVQFGRLGTAGQTQTKDYASDAAAQQAADKLIAEKTKKGYVEAGDTPPAGAAKPKPAAKAKPVPVGEPAPAASALAVTRTIDLAPRDWLWATWRPRQPLPKPDKAPPPFDQKKALERFEAGIQVGPNWWYFGGPLNKPPFSREEAHFWFFALTQGPECPTREKGIKDLSKGRFDGRVTLATVAQRLPHTGQPADRLYQVLPYLLDPEQFVALVGEGRFGEQTWAWRHVVSMVFLELVLPYLGAEEVEGLKPLARKMLAKNAAPKAPSDSYEPIFRLAAALGLHKEIEAVVAAWPDGSQPGVCWQGEPQWLVFGLGDARSVDRHMRRLGFGLGTPDQARAWLAHTEFAGLDVLRDSVLAPWNKPRAEALFKVFRLVRAPEAAPHMLELKLNSKVQGLAGEWLDENPGDAVAGLIPVAAGAGKLAEAAAEFLRGAKKKGQADFIAEHLKSAPTDGAARVREAVLEHEEKVYEPLDAKATPKPLRDALAKSAADPALPSWAAPALLPPLLVGCRRLSDDQAAAVLAALRRTPLGATEPLLDALKAHADRAALDAFAWRLFEQWLAAGAPVKEKWAIFTIGHLSGDASVLKLTPLVRAWPGENQHGRAVLGLECLRAVGTDTALMQLNGIAQKLKFQGLKAKAQEFMEAIAKDKGLTREELEDRVVPDLDLDERGTRVLDFGPRQFSVVLGPDLAPLVRDEDGKVKSDLPKPGAKDDPEKAAAAVETWKLLKKQLREVLKIQAPRLEQAMVTGRRWPVEQFQALLVRHPLMTNLARRLLWGGYDAKGKLNTLFRVTEDQELVGADDKPCALKGVASVGIVHPLHLTEEQRSAWGQVFGDYEIIPPFPQLGRPVFAPEPVEAKAKAITRLAKTKLHPMSVRGTLEKLGWTRGSASDHGVIQEFTKHFPTAGVTAVAEVEPGIPIGNPDWSEDQEVKRVFFLGGGYESLAYPYHKEEKFTPVNKVDPVTASEVLSDVEALAAKAK